MSLLEMIFHRSSHDRILTFTDIASKTRVPVEQVNYSFYLILSCFIFFIFFLLKVDWILMKALSLGLIKGTIDEVDQHIAITWVQPKVLDHEQIKVIVGQLNDWSERVKRTLLTVEEQALELYV